jgi:hypothetical protein
MTTAQLFNLVAPIAIYHGADVCYGRKARRAICRVRNLADTDPEIRRRFGARARRQDWADYHEHAEPENLPNILDLYKDLFREIVQGERPEWCEFVDRWGAYGYKDEHGQIVFSGDACFCFPWYETAELLAERIEVHSEPKAA